MELCISYLNYLILQTSTEQKQFLFFICLTALKRLKYKIKGLNTKIDWITFGPQLLLGLDSPLKQFQNIKHPTVNR